MRRVSVVGNSGSGKSTLGRALAARLGVPFVELDAIHHLPGWQPIDVPEFRKTVGAIVDGDGWVIDGNYSAVRDLVWARADTVIWFDLPRRTVIRQVLWRTIRRGVTREELWNGNRERLTACSGSTRRRRCCAGPGPGTRSTGTGTHARRPNARISTSSASAPARTPTGSSTGGCPARTGTKSDQHGSNRSPEPDSTHGTRWKGDTMGIRLRAGLAAIGLLAATGTAILAAAPAHTPTRPSATSSAPRPSPGRPVHRAEQQLGRQHDPVHRRQPEHRLHGHHGQPQQADQRRPRRYPSVFFGCHYANCSSGSGLPHGGQRQPRSAAISTSVTMTYPGSGVYDAAYDIWFDPTAAHRRPEHRRRAHGVAQPHRLDPARRLPGRHGQHRRGTWDVWEATSAGTSSPTCRHSPPARSASPSTLLSRRGQPWLRATVLVPDQHPGRLRAVGRRHRALPSTTSPSRRRRHRRPDDTRRPRHRHPTRGSLPGGLPTEERVGGRLHRRRDRDQHRSSSDPERLDGSASPSPVVSRITSAWNATVTQSGIVRDGPEPVLQRVDPARRFYLVRFPGDVLGFQPVLVDHL